MTRHDRSARRAWFLRVRHGPGRGLRPNSSAGWLLTFLFVAATTGLSLLLLGTDEPDGARLATWAGLLAAITLAFVVTAFRMSETADPSHAAPGHLPAGSNRLHTVVIPLLAAAAIIGAAMLAFAA